MPNSRVCFSGATSHRMIGDVTPMELSKTIKLGPRQHRNQLHWLWCNKRGRSN